MKNNAMALKKNDMVRVKITDMSFDGQGIGRTDDGFVVFVKGALTGETADVHILKVLKNSAYAKIISVIQPSEKRCEPSCPVFSKCGGCAYMHTSYENELKIKSNHIKSVFKNIAGLDISPLPILSGAEYGYRNKALVPLCKNADGKICAGFYRRNSHTVIPMENCLISHEDFFTIINCIVKFCEKYKIEPYDETTKKGAVRHIFIRRGYHSGEIMAGVITKTQALPHADKLIEMLHGTKLNIVSIIQNINPKDTNVILGEKTKILYGEPYIKDSMLGNSFMLSCPSFYQVNTPMAERLYTEALSYLDEADETVFDLYSGAGTITLSIAKKAKTVYGIESCAPAVENARQNACLNGIENVQFICGNAEDEIFTLLNDGIIPDAVVVDPPRSGCDKRLINALLETKPKKIIYISCNPSTLARDVSLLKEVYTPSAVRPVDLFPKTAHVETIVLLQNRNM